MKNIICVILLIPACSGNLFTAANNLDVDSSVLDSSHKKEVIIDNDGGREFPIKNTEGTIRSQNSFGGVANPGKNQGSAGGMLNIGGNNTGGFTNIVDGNFSSGGVGNDSGHGGFNGTGGISSGGVPISTGGVQNTGGVIESGGSIGAGGTVAIDYTRCVSATSATGTSYYIMVGGDNFSNLNYSGYKGGIIDVCCRQTPADCYWFQSMNDCSYAFTINNLCSKS